MFSFLFLTRSFLLPALSYRSRQFPVFFPAAQFLLHISFSARQTACRHSTSSACLSRVKTVPCRRGEQIPALPLIPKRQPGYLPPGSLCRVHTAHQYCP